MKKMLSALFAFSLLTNAHAQTHDIDSLNQLLQKEKTDTGRVLILSELAYHLHESKPDTAMTLALQGLELSRKIHYEKGEAVSLNRSANAYSVLGNYPKEMTALFQALEINEKINNSDGQQRNLNNLGLIYMAQEDYQLALQYLFRAKSVAEQINDRSLLCGTLGNIAAMYRDLKSYDSAVLFAHQPDSAYYYSKLELSYRDSLSTRTDCTQCRT